MDKSTQLSTQSPQIYQYVILPRLGMNLYDFIRQRKADFTKEQVCSLGIQLLNILERIHHAGFVYNDLKLDNILLDFNVDMKSYLSTTQEDIFDQSDIHLVDFGFVTPYLDPSSTKHVEKHLVDVFRGNIVFSSLNQLNFCSTGRRDDLISLFYLLTYLLHQGKMPGLDFATGVDEKKLFHQAKEVRQNQKSRDICFGNSKDLKALYKEIFTYRFSDQPDYDHLRTLLLEIKQKEITKKSKL